MRPERAEETVTIFKYDYGKPDIGVAGPEEITYRDLLQQDRYRVPAGLLAQGDYRAKRMRIPYEIFYDSRYAELEMEHIWKKQWQMACREEDIPNVGDRIRYDVADLSFFVVRVAENRFQGFWNSCAHRGRQLCDGFASGEHIQCRFHGWTYDLDGTNRWVPADWDFPARNKYDFNLRRVRTERWGGQVFINPDDDAPPLAEALGPLVEHFRDFPIDGTYTNLFLRKKLRANWKVAQDAFQESYHVIETHWDGLPLWSDTMTTYDCWGDETHHIGRLVTPVFTTSGYMKDRVSQKECTDHLIETFFEVQKADPARGHTLEDARAYGSDRKKELLEQQTGRSYRHRSDAEMVDFIKYNMFPNFQPWAGEFLPILYRFLPLRNPEESVLEIRFLAPIPESGEYPPPAEPVEIDFDEQSQDKPGLEFMGYIVDQDLGNMPAVQRGIHCAKPGTGFPMLGRYQEQILSHWYEVYGNLIGVDFSVE